jgi:hypothetical protein
MLKGRSRRFRAAVTGAFPPESERMGILRAAVLALLIGSPGSVWAEPPSQSIPPDPARDALIADLMDLSGMDVGLRQLSDLMRAELDRPPDPELDPSFYEVLRAVLLGAYQPEPLRRGVMESLAADYDPERFAAIRDLLESPLVRRMTALDVAAGTPEAQADMEANEAALLAGATRDRLALVGRLDNALGATGLTTELALMPVQAIATMHFPLLPEAERERRQAELDEAVDQLRPEVHAAVHQAVVVSYLYTYRGVDDADLAAYVARIESDVGQDWVRRSTVALRHAFASAQAHAAAEVMRRLVGGTEI